MKRRVKGVVLAIILCFLLLHLVSFHGLWEAEEVKAQDRHSSAGRCSGSPHHSEKCEHFNTSSDIPMSQNDHNGDDKWTPAINENPQEIYLKTIKFHPPKNIKFSEKLKDKTAPNYNLSKDFPSVMSTSREALLLMEDSQNETVSTKDPFIIPGPAVVSMPDMHENLSNNSKSMRGQFKITAPRLNLSSDLSSPEEFSNNVLPPRPTINKKKKRQVMKDSPLVLLKRDKHWPALLAPSNAAIFSNISFSRYTPEDRQFLEGRVGVYEARARQVAEVCDQHEALDTPISVKTMVWDQKHQPNIIWCELSKVASTSWMINFLRLAHYRENDTSLAHLPPKERDELRFKFEDVNVHSIVYRLFPAPNNTRDRARVFRRALRVIIVRHPFTRLLSAYKDKMTTLTPKPKTFRYRQLQLKIIKRYRPSSSNDTSLFPTFHEFIQYVIDSTAHLKTLKQWKKIVCWTPYWAQCAVCAHDFQLIIKLETMADDERFLIILANLHELEEVHERRNIKASTSNTDNFFRQLSTRQMQQLHQRYLLDFQLFGYTLDKYLSLARDATVTPAT
ncbi:uncharacterized protein LOC121867039 isoform X2 [Homarus americanus]|uniref:uncharacterized protein LOC121867039 isoform X2 n=1 Tax=Homarus americanus TaxID=6706 RepID=UPI001C467181|nr:uncharacterized protein LOC121867039 isoform X2 [Homarus americanus]